MAEVKDTPNITAPTPGPWKMSHRRVIERPVKISEHFAIAPAAGPTFAFLPEGRADVQEANARLIAAAPDLLDAAKGLALWLDDKKVVGDEIGSLGRILGFVNRVIAKAEGRL